MDTIELVKLVVNLAIVPAVIFAYKLNSELSSLKSGIKDMREQNSKEHADVLHHLHTLGSLVKEGERDNRIEHKELGQRIHELDAANRVEHAILSNGGKL